MYHLYGTEKCDGSYKLPVPMLRCLCHGSTVCASKGEAVQHILARQNDANTLCGIPRDSVVQSGAKMCPDCAALDRMIQDSITLIRDSSTRHRMTKYIISLTNPQPQVTTEERPKQMDYKASATKALKRGASAGIMKAVNKKIKEKLTEKFPQLALIPDNIWNVLLCLAINMAASASPDLPGIKLAESLSQEAFEGLLTDATSQIIQDVVAIISETMLELTEKNDGSKCFKELKKPGIQGVPVATV
jgi:hypothetical protein